MLFTNVFVFEFNLFKKICWFLNVHRWGAIFLGQWLVEQVHVCSPAFLVAIFHEAIQRIAYLFVSDAFDAFEKDKVFSLLSILDLIDNSVLFSIIKVSSRWYCVGQSCVSMDDNYTNKIDICNSFEQGDVISPQL